MTENFNTSQLSSMEKIRIHKHDDGSVTLTVFGDSSHGDRLFNFHHKDWEMFKENIEKF